MRGNAWHLLRVRTTLMNNKPGHQHVSASAQSASKASCDAPSNPTCSKVSATDLSRSCRGSSSNSVTFLLVVGNSWSMYGRLGSVRAFLLECCSVVSSGLCDGVGRFRRLMSIGAMIAVHRVLVKKIDLVQDQLGYIRDRIPCVESVIIRLYSLRVAVNRSLDISRTSRIHVTCFGHFSSSLISAKTIMRFRPYSSSFLQPRTTIENFFPEFTKHTKWQLHQLLE